MSLRGHVFDKQLFHNEIYALFQDTFLDGESGILPKFKSTETDEGMKVYTNDNNRKLYIKNGAACICGRFVEETDEVNDISDLLPEGNNYCILVIEIDLSLINGEDDFRQAQYKVLSNSTSYPNLIQNDIVNRELKRRLSIRISKI